MKTIPPELGKAIAARVANMSEVAGRLSEAICAGAIAEIISTPGASEAATQAKIGFTDPDQIVQAEWSGMDDLEPKDWAEFARRRAILERELARQNEMQARGAEANRERHMEAERRRARHRLIAATMRAADPGKSDVQIARLIFESLPADKRKDQTPETIRKNIRIVGTAL